MGGSGGGGFFSGTTNPEELRRQIGESEDKARNDLFEIEAAKVLGSLLSEVNTRDSHAIGTHLDQILGALRADIEGSISLLFGGSISKHTYVNGLSDIDALVILNKSDLIEMTPSQVRAYFVERLKERFPQTPIQEGSLAVTVSFSDIDIQLLPAIKDDSGVRISAEDSSRWSPTIRPDRFATKLTSINQNMSGKLIPVIKLAKAILSKLPENQQLSGYHIESLAIQVFKDYKGEKMTKAMLRHFFNNAPNYILQPIKDSTEQSVHVDDYLGGKRNLQRRIIADSVGRIGRSMQNADRAHSVEQWKEILGAS